MKFFNPFNILLQILEVVTKMTATLAQLDAQLAANNALLTTMATDLAQLVSDYNALVANAANGVDVTNELATANEQAQQLQADISSITTADPAKPAA